MVAYIDSSVVLRHILLGDSSIHHAMALPRLVSSELLEIECRRTINRCRLNNELDDAALASAMDRLENVLAMMDLVELDRAIKKRAMGSFPVIIKTLDALHVSTALVLLESGNADEVLIFSHDRAMNLCARALGFGAPLATEG